MIRFRALFVLVPVCSFVLSCSKPNPPEAQHPAVKLRQLEGYPAAIIHAIADQGQAVGAAGGHLAHLYQIRSKARTWPAKHIITVAFEGGSSNLRSQITQAVKPWVTDNANITFDFGPNRVAGQFREWGNTDTQYAADVRIAFRTGKEGGYWSMVGNDSVKPSLVKPNQPSMNFEGFPDELPTDWQTTVLHEFGHALGFEHEHQSPIAPCESEFRWENDPGYAETRDTRNQFVRDSNGRRPGIYTVLEGPPNKWDKDQINFNLRQLPQSADWVLSSFDKTSIMKYQFDSWMFNQGSQSKCYSDENLVLSPDDLAAAQKIYPRSTNDVANALNLQINANQQLMKLKGLPPPMLSEFKANIDLAKRAKRP
jgi:hypothetical protein